MNRPCRDWDTNKRCKAFTEFHSAEIPPPLNTPLLLAEPAHEFIGGFVTAYIRAECIENLDGRHKYNLTVQGFEVTAKSEWMLFKESVLLES